MKLKQLFRRKLTVKQLFPKTQQVIEEAFEIGGIKYYHLADTNTLNAMRGLAAFAIYNELDMRCSRDYLLKHQQAIDSILKSREVDIFKIKQLNDQLNQRLNLITDIDLMYKLASVAFFDENENPESYDYAYNEKKIKFWKENTGVADFFLSLPVMKLMPFLTDVDIDLDSYSILNDELNQIHLDLLRIMSSKSV